MTHVHVRLVHSDGVAALVEWLDCAGIHRAVIPAVEVGPGRNVPDYVLDAGVAYGEKWSAIEGVTEELEQALYNRGIWTRGDMLVKSQLARQAVQKVMVVPVVVKLLEAARR